MCMGQDGHTGPFLTYPTVGLIVDRWRIGVESCLSHTYGYVTFPTVILKIHMDRWSIPHRDMHGRWSILYTGNIYWQMINPTLGTHIWTGDQFYTGSCMERWSIQYWECALTGDQSYTGNTYTGNTHMDGWSILHRELHGKVINPILGTHINLHGDMYGKVIDPIILRMYIYIQLP